jgi:N-acetylmuramoyl-L-alanine amidase
VGGLLYPLIASALVCFCLVGGASSGPWLFLKLDNADSEAPLSERRELADGSLPNAKASTDDPPTAPSIGRAVECQRTFRIVIDVGHSRQASGAVSARGRAEFDFNLVLAEVVKRELDRRGYQHTYVLVSNGGPNSLLERTVQAERLRADVFISIHHDSVQPNLLGTWIVDGRPREFDDQYSGFSLLVSTSNPQARASMTFAKLLADRLISEGMNFSTHHAANISGERHKLIDPERGIYQYNGLVVLRSARTPAVLLEAGIIVNRIEEVKLTQPERQQKIASAVSDAVGQFCVLTKFVND